MTFTIPPLEDVQPPKWVKPSFGNRARSAVPALIVLVAIANRSRWLFPYRTA